MNSLDTQKALLIKKANEMGIELTGLENMPMFGMAPVNVMIGPNEYIAVKDRFYTMSSMDGGQSWEPIKEISAQYALVQHYEAVDALLDSVQKMVPTFGVPEIHLIFSGSGNCKMFNDVRWKNAELTVNNDKIIPVLRQENSIDTSRRFLSQFRAERLVCSNGMTVPDSRFPEKGQVRKLHKKGTLNLQDALEITEKNVDTFIKTIKMWEGWDRKGINPEQMEKVFDAIGISDIQAQDLLNAPLRGFNERTLSGEFESDKADFWIAYNAVTQWVTDNTKNPATESERSRNAADMFEKLYLV